MDVGPDRDRKWPPALAALSWWAAYCHHVERETSRFLATYPLEKPPVAEPPVSGQWPVLDR